MKKLRPIDWVAMPITFLVALGIYLFLGGPFGLGQLLVIAAIVVVGYPLMVWWINTMKRKTSQQ
ncbi:Flp pilus assembly protein TadB [Psychromicrobium silvestre]|uniref:Flp pilus assembly protein TadB n=1 Tax=Psychromicrobium silvestre TaxID=1645614 RepID=A0A7Y9LR27_9MICC|nr:hypothetical protein [Psychromicrobium silvestre]NYE94028.1 Flp pilus assembly protein TadB [Psychromicrobium silvestre]